MAFLTSLTESLHSFFPFEPFQISIYRYDQLINMQIHCDEKREKRECLEYYHRNDYALYVKAGIQQRGNYRRYPLRAHSIGKYFRRHFGSTSTIPTDYINHVMGHTISTYNDIRMKGIEHLRNLYAASGLSVRPKTKLPKIERLKMFTESPRFEPEEVLSRKALIRPHRTVVDPEHGQIEALNQALKQAIIEELRR